MFEVGLNREFASEQALDAGVLGGALAPEALLPFFRRAIGDDAQLARESLAHVRWVTEIVTALAPFRVRADNLALQ